MGALRVRQQNPEPPAQVPVFAPSLMVCLILECGFNARRHRIPLRGAVSVCVKKKAELTGVGWVALVDGPRKECLNEGVNVRGEAPGWKILLL